MPFVNSLLFHAAVATVFGSAFLQRHGIEALQAAFHAFETNFELAASPIPHMFIPGFCRARRFLMAAFR